MRRALALLASIPLLIAGGCGGKSYEHRLDKTLEQMRYSRRLDDNLMAAPKGKLENQIFVRPPMTLEGPTKEFAMTALEPGKFDISESFFDKEKQSYLYILARVPKPKTPANKKAAAPDTANRGEFVPDVVAELTKTYSVEIDPTKAKEETKQPSLTKFKHLTFATAAKTVQVYISGAKQSYEVALIFEYPNAEHKALNTKIDLTLGSFATGEKARRAFNGNLTDEESGEGGPAPAAAF
jgi:hypothetical protein